MQAICFVMKTILVLGAGRSSSVLIDYLVKHAAGGQWQVVVGDLQKELALQKLNDSPYGEAILFNIADIPASAKVIARSDVVVSLLPAHLHASVAMLCVEHGKHLITASYVSPDMQALHHQALKKGVLLLNECGLDPGIDHMSAMEMIHRIQAQGGEVYSFESFTGGLIAPQTDPDNPWRYKFTWNPRNVVMAGQGTARYLEEGRVHYISYAQLFRRITRVEVTGYGDYEGYANRDSLPYQEVYGLQKVKTLLRGTLRCKGFCQAWNVLVQLGMCDDTYTVWCEDLTHSDFTSLFLPHDHRTVEERLMAWFGLEANGAEMQRLRWSGFFSQEPVGLKQGTPAQITEHILNKRWALKPEDRDMIVMWHRLRYEINSTPAQIRSALVVTGTDATRTAMATTVGLPLGIATRLLLEGKISARGVVIPVLPEIYRPVLNELQHHGILFREEHA